MDVEEAFETLDNNLAQINTDEEMDEIEEAIETIKEGRDAVCPAPGDLQSPSDSEDMQRLFAAISDEGYVSSVEWTKETEDYTTFGGSSITAMSEIIVDMTIVLPGDAL